MNFSIVQIEFIKIEKNCTAWLKELHVEIQRKYISNRKTTFHCVDRMASAKNRPPSQTLLLLCSSTLLLFEDIL
jgi:hypothetical protein